MNLPAEHQHRPQEADGEDREDQEREVVTVLAAAELVDHEARQHDHRDRRRLREDRQDRRDDERRAVGPQELEQAEERACVRGGHYRMVGDSLLLYSFPTCSSSPASRHPSSRPGAAACSSTSQTEGLAGCVLFDDRYVQYFTSFNFLATERPVGVAMDAEGSLAVFVPEFEVERVRAETAFERDRVVPGVPGHRASDAASSATSSRTWGSSARSAADNDGYPGILGYQGPSLTEVLGATVTPLGPLIESLMVRKSAAEVELIRESARWCEHAHRLLQEYSVPGSTEAQAGLRAGYETTLAMLDALGPGYSGQLSSTDGASAGYRGQVGQRSAWAHAVAHNIPFEAGQVLVTETAAPVWGYNAELERAMIIGTPTDEMRRLFDHTVAAQQAAFDALRPGVTCADVDQAVIDYLEANDLLHYWRQHVGHGIGLRNHEAPFLDVGDFTVVEPGMVFTIEPGLYDDVIGGFRHSDTVVVTEDGIDILTSYPKDIESLTIPA